MHRQRAHAQPSPPTRPSKPEPQTVPRHVTLKPARLSTTVLNSWLVFFNFLFCITLVLLDVTPFDCSHLSRQARLSTDQLYASQPSKQVLSSTPKVLSYDYQNFSLDGHPIRLISGSVHYFRIPPSQWRSTLKLARHMGLNAIETYVPWNLHEPAKGVFRFSGMLDLPRFLSIAQELHLLVLLRPGPYICSEIDFGGLPPYLLSDPSMKVRSLHQGYMKAVRRYISTLSRIIDPFVGRPIVGIQIENEYGRYTGDQGYMVLLVDMWKNHDITKDRLVHFTSDSGNANSMVDGSPFRSIDVLKTINFGNHVNTKMKILRSVQPEGPPMVMEYWAGWFDHWGSPHHTRPAGRVAKMLREIIFNYDASVNLYMFMGGTNFGFTSGANFDTERGYQSDTTSYDYDAFITEHGEIRNPKFNTVRDLIREFWTSMGDEKRLAIMDEPPPPSPGLSAYSGKVALTASVPLLNVLEEASAGNTHIQYPISIETAGGDYGYVLYRHVLPEPSEKGSVLQISDVRDLGFIMFNGVVTSMVHRKHPNDTTDSGDETPTNIKLVEGTKNIDILVENSGRVNYGTHIHDRKGLLGNITKDDEPLQEFDMYLLSFPQDHDLLRDIDLRTSIDATVKAMHGRLDHPPMGESTSQPAVFSGSFTIDSESTEGKELRGTFCQVIGRGALWINGFNVGRFNTGISGPQRSLFVPGSLLREGQNDIFVFHLDMHLASEPPTVEFFDHPDYEHTERNP